MFQLSVQDIHPGQQAGNKEEAIRQVAAALVSAGNVADGYVNGMLAREQQTSTFLGNGIAIPHGTTDTRDQVLKTGVQVFQFPQGVTWGEGQTAYVAIGIAASSDEHLGLLRQLTHVLSDDAVAAQLQSATTAEELRALLMGEKQSEALKLDNETLSLDVAASDLLTLQALNAARLKEAGAVDAAFVSHVINDTPLNLGQGVWLNDSAEGNLRSAVAVSRAANAFTRDEQPVSLLVTVAMADEQPTAVLNRLSKLLLDKKAEHLLKADAATVLTNPPYGERLLDVKAAEVFEMEKRMLGSDVEIDEPSGGAEEGTAPSEWLTDERDTPENTIARGVYENTIENRLPEAVKKLDDRSRRIIEARWLYNDQDGSKGATLADLAKEMGVSQERVRQLEKKAFATLKTYLKEDKDV